MEVTDLNDLLNVRSIKMETTGDTFVDDENIEDGDALSIIPQYVTESDLGLMQSGAEILEAPLSVFADTNEHEQLQGIETCEEVVQIMNIRTQLSKLKSMLEKRLKVDLSSYTFWLQDAKMLEEHRTLVEQCISGSGAVQVHVQLRHAARRINILDVLKPDDDHDDHHDPDDPDDPHVDANDDPLHELEMEDTGEPEIESVSMMENLEEGQELEYEEVPEVAEVEPAPKRQVVTVKWVVDERFRSEHSKVKIPDNPRDWSVAHVKAWIVWAVRQFKLAGVRLADWNISGAQLCALSHLQFKEKVPSDPGDLFWTHLELLRKCQFIAVVQEEPAEAPLVAEPQCAIKRKQLKKPPPKTVVVCGEQMSRALHRAGNNGQIQLWQFLLELLTSADFYDAIRWTGKNGEFKLLEPERVARLWGVRKHKPAMNYEKLSRALRYYYDGDMIAKVPNKRFVYRFVCDLRQLLGYDAAELSALVHELYLAKKKDKHDQSQ